MNPRVPAGWFPDPFGRFQHRYWDGAQWTEHVGSYGRQMVDAPVTGLNASTTTDGAATTAVSEAMPREVRGKRNVERQVRKLGIEHSVSAGGGTLFTERILVVNQKAKLFERKAEYTVFDQYGCKVGTAREFGSSISRHVVGRDHATKRLEVLNADGQPLLTLTRPAVMMKSRVVVTRSDGTTVGQIVQENLGVLGPVLGGRFNVRFDLESEGHSLGSIITETWEAWDFRIQDPHGDEIARITKTWAGLAKEAFTTADHYVLELHRSLEDPLLTLVVSASLAIDTVLRQSGDRQRS